MRQGVTAFRGTLPFVVFWRAALMLGCVLSSVRAYAFSDSVPDWVREAAHQTLPALPANTKAVVLLDEHTYTVGVDGRATEHVRNVVKIVRPQGREAALPLVWFDKDSKLLSMHVWSIDPAGKEYAMKDNQLLELGHPGEGGELYDDQKARYAEPPGRDPGGVVAYEYEQRQRPYVAEANWFFQDDMPRMRQSFTLTLPPGFSYSTSWANHDPVQGADLEDRRYRWEMNNESAIDLEQVPLRPAGESLSARMTVHYAGPGLAEPREGTWQGVGQWYDALARERAQPTPEITAKAQELIAGKTDFYDKAEAISDFVQQKIRYFVIEVGIGGNQPHFAGDIFKGRYGDCKDKATLLSAMLASVGLHGDLVMVDSHRGFINPDDPSVLGNHVVAAIEVPAGYNSPKLHSVITTSSGKRYLIFDPTWEKTPFGQVENDLQGSYGVLVEGSQSQLIRIPVMSPELNRVRRSATFSLNADGSLKGTMTDLRFGDIADRRRREYMRDDGKHQEEFLRKVAGQDMMAVSLSNIKVANLDAISEDLSTRFDVQASHYATATGPLLMLRPRVLGSYELGVDRKPRKVNIDLYETMLGNDEFDIELPEGYVVDELPDPVKEDFGFATYQSSTVVHGRTLHYSRTYTLREVTLPPAKYADVQRLSAVIGADEASQVVLKKQQ